MNKRKVLFAVLVCLVFLGLVGCKTNPDVNEPISTQYINMVLENVNVSIEYCRVNTPNPTNGKTETFWGWKVESNFPSGTFGYFFEVSWGDGGKSSQKYVNNQASTLEEPHQFVFSDQEKYSVALSVVGIRNESGIKDIEPIEVWLGVVSKNGL